MLRRRMATAAIAGPLTLLALSWVATQQPQGALAFAPPLPAACRTTALYARKNSGKSKGSGKGAGSPSAGKGFGQASANTEPAAEPAAEEAQAAPAGGELDEKQREELKEDLKNKMARLGGAIGALAAQVDEQDEEDDGEDYSPRFVAEQKRLREALDFERPYVRDRPRNWDYITGLPVPRRIKIEQMIPIPDPALRAQYREPRPNDPAFMAQRIRELFVPGADLEELRSWYIANRDWLGQGVRLILAAKSLRLSWLKDYEESRRWLQALEQYRTVECAVTCHLQQGMREAEIRLSQNLGNLDMVELAGTNPADQACMWITLKAVLAKWETRREKYLKLEKRSLPQDRALAGTRKVVTLFQKMNVAFSECEEVMQTLPGEMVYLDTALGIASGTELRRWTLKVFCPAAGISVEELRERVRGLAYLLQDLPHGEMAELNAKLVEIYRALALGTAEFETDAPLDIVAALLPDDTRDPEAPYPFRLDYRLDAAQEVRRISAQSAAEKLDVYLKKMGIPFPESPKVRLEPKPQAEDLWFDNWAIAWRRKPEDWYPEPIVPESEKLRGTFGQDFIDKMQRAITTRKRTMKSKRFGMEDGADDDDEPVPDNPITKWNEDEAERSPEEKSAVEAWLAEQEEKHLRAFEDGITVWAPEGEGDAVLTFKEVQAKYMAGADFTPPPLPHPKLLLKQLEEENRRWAAKTGQAQPPAPKAGATR